MPRSAAELRAAATATGLFNGPTLSYVGDGYSVPYQCPPGFRPSTSVPLLAYKLYLDTNYLEFSRLHDWLYTPFGGLIGATQDESDRALREELGEQSAIDGEVVYLACATFGYLYFGSSTVGYVPGSGGTFLPDMGVTPVLRPTQNGAFMGTKVVILIEQTTQRGTAAPELGYSSPVRTGGWSESIYFNGSVADTIAALTQNRSGGISPLLLTRANLLGVEGRVTGARLYANGVGHGQLLANAYPGNTTFHCDQPQQSLLMSATSTVTGSTRRWLLRGIPDDMITFGEFSPTTAYRTWMKDYTKSLTGFGWTSQGVSKQAKLFNITTDGVITVDQPTQPFLVGEIVTLSKILFTNGQFGGGRYQVTGTATGGKFTITGWPNRVGTGGTAKIITPVVETIDVNTKISVVRASTRKVGRPFDGYRGRRSPARQEI